MENFVKISKYAGMREDLVQAGGGNSSYKLSDGKMVIKASGYQLADVTESEGYAVVNASMIQDRFLGCEDIDALTEADSKKILQDALIEGGRPSIETFLHAISGKYTLHTHPMVVNVMTCRTEGMEVLGEMFPDALLVPYATPGVELAKVYFKAYKEYQKKTGCLRAPNIVFLQNHGLVVSGDNADEVISGTEEVTHKLEEYLKISLDSYHRLTILWTYFEEKVVWEVTDRNIYNAYEDIGELWRHVFCPDCVVFLGKKLLELPDEFTGEFISDFIAEYAAPVMIRWHNSFYILADSVKKALETQSVMSFSAQVMALNKGRECNLLSDDEQNFLLNWDAEKYRKYMK